MNDLSSQTGGDAAPRRGVAWGWVLLSFGIQLGALAPLFFCQIYVVPKFVQIFADLGTALPVLTQAVIQGSRILGHVLVLPPLLALLFLASVGLGARRLHPGLLWGWTAAVVAIAAVATAAVIVALFLPMLTIVESLK